MMNLILAAIWFSAAAFFYVHNPDAGGRGVLKVPLSGVALVLGLYNLIRGAYSLRRWWRLRDATLPAGEAQHPTLPRRRLRRASDDMPEPDPNFVFTDPPPA